MKNLLFIIWGVQIGKALSFNINPKSDLVKRNYIKFAKETGYGVMDIYL